MLDRLVNSDYWPGMKKDRQLQVAAFPGREKFHNPSKRQRAKLDPITKNDGGDILAIYVFGGKASLLETGRANKYILTSVHQIRRSGTNAGPICRHSW